MAKPILIYYSVLDFQESSLALMRDLFQVVELPSPEADTDAALAPAEALVAPFTFPCDAEKIARCPRLRAIGSPTTGLPHVDESAAAAAGVKICSLKDQQAFLRDITPTAELAWGMLLALTRHIPQALGEVLAGRWDGKGFGRATPRMLSTMSLGVIGLGRLGSLVAGYGQAFGMRVGYFDPTVANPDYTRHASLLDLARASDVVSIHVHGAPENDKMIGADFLATMPAGGFFINSARGSLLDEAALLAALESGRLAGAALDTVEGEHLPEFAQARATHPLFVYARTRDNLLLTPHYGGATRDSWELTESRIIKMMHQAVTGEAA